MSRTLVVAIAVALAIGGFIASAPVATALPCEDGNWIFVWIPPNAGVYWIGWDQDGEWVEVRQDQGDGEPCSSPVVQRFETYQVVCMYENALEALPPIDPSDPVGALIEFLVDGCRIA